MTRPEESIDSRYSSSRKAVQGGRDGGYGFTATGAGFSIPYTSRLNSSTFCE